MRFLATFVGVGTYADPLIRELVGATRDAKALHALFADSAPSSAQHRSNFNEKIGIIGQVIQTIANDSGGVRFIISKGTKPTTKPTLFSFL